MGRGENVIPRFEYGRVDTPDSSVLNCSPRFVDTALLLHCRRSDWVDCCSYT